MSSSDCIFCQIANKEAEAEVVYEDNEVMAFKDINPVTPVHLLIIPKKHIPTHYELKEEDIYLISKIHLIINDLARAFEVNEDGYRVMVNCGQHAGQIVYHLHFHLLAGRPLDSMASSQGA